MSNVNNPPDQRLTPKEAAEYIGCHHVWLAQLRMQKKGPPFIKFGKFVRYTKRDVDAWLAANTISAA